MIQTSVFQIRNIVFYYKLIGECIFLNVDVRNLKFELRVL